MSQQFQPWKTGRAQTLWLLRLVEAMEKISSADWRTHRIDRVELAAFQAHLTRAATVHPVSGSRFSLRN
ncbi:MAG: hypothetical protein WA820_29245 [Bradyrhizobium sp.]|jgi:hypothetical protein